MMTTEKPIQDLAVRLGPKALEELRAMYDGDTHLLSEINLRVVDQTVHGAAHNLRELVYLIRSDYDLELGFETVDRAVKRRMLNAAARIEKACQPGAKA